MAYATHDDVYAALSAQAFVVRARPVDTSRDVDIETGTVRLEAHGFSSLDVITVEVVSGGKLPRELSAFVAYNPVVVTSDLFRFSLSGTPISRFDIAGSGWRVKLDTVRRLGWHLDDATARIDEKLTANTPPLVAPYPRVVIGICARMAARSCLTSLQVENAQYQAAIDRLFAQEREDGAMLAAWLAGKPINPRATDQTPEPDNGPRARYGSVAAAWETRVM